MDNQFSILLKAALNIQQSQNELNKQISQLQKNAKELEIPVEISTASAKKAIKELSTEAQESLSLNKIKLSNNVESYIRNNTKLSKDLVSQLTNVKGQIESVGSAQGLKQLSQKFSVLRSESDALGVSGDTAFTKLGNHVKELLGFFSSATIVMGSIRTLQGLVSTVTELDKSIVDLQMATGYTNSQAKELLNTYIDMGQQLGATGTEVAASASSWLKQGKSIADTNKLIQYSIMLSKLGSIESADATKYLTTITKSYGIAVNDTLSVVDKLSKVDLISATDVGGLAQALNEVSANANSLGINLDELLGYIASIGETSGEQMSAVGNALNAMFSRMANIKLKRLVDPETNEDLSNTETSLRRVGIQLRTDTGTFRDFSDVLKEVAGNWSGYNDVTKQSIAASIAGVNHMNDFKILMQQFGKATEYTSESMNSSGSAMQKFSAYEESVEAKTKRVQASLQELSSDTLNSGVIKSFLDLSNVLVQGADKIGIFNIALIALAGVIGTKTTLGMTAFQGVLEKSIIKMGVGATAAETLGMALSTMIPAALIIGGITAVVKLYEHLNVTLEEQKQKLEDTKSAYSESSSELESINNELKTASDRIDELNKKDSLTFTEQSELDKLKEANEYLLIQQDLLNKQKESKAKDVASTTVDTFNKAYGKGSISQNQVDTYVNDSNASGNNAILMSDQNNISSMIAAYKQFNKLKEEAYSSGNTDDVEHFKGLLDQISTSLYSNVDDLNEYKKTLESIPYDQLSEEQKNVLNNINSGISLIYKNLDPAKWKEISFNKIFDSKDYEDTKNKLNDLSKAGKLDGSVIANNKEYQKLLYDTGLTATEVATQVNALNGVTDKSSGSLSETSDSANETTQSLYSLAESAKSATGYVNELGSDVDISKLQDAISNAQNSVNDFNSILKSMDDNNGLTSDSLDTITQKYPQLLKYVSDEAELRKQLQNSIKEQKETAEDYYKSVLEMDTDLYNSIVKNNADRINKLSDDYKTDIQNWQSLAQAKADIDGKLLTELNQKWGDYYSQRAKLASLENAIQTDNNPILQQSSDLNLFGVGNVTNPNNTFLDDQKKKLQELANEANSTQNSYNDLKNLFEGTDYTSKLANTISTVGDKTKKSTKSASEFSQQIDWIATSVEKAEDKVSKFKDTMSDDAPYKKQISNLNSLIALQKDLVSTYEKGEKAYKSQYDASIKGLNKKYVTSIQNGKTFNIQDFKGESGEKLYNQIIKAQGYWKDYQDLVGKVDSTNKSILDSSKKVLTIQTEQLKKEISSLFDTIDKVIDKYNDAFSSINNLASKYDDGSTQQINTYADGINKATEEVKYLNDEIDKLNQMKTAGKFKGNMTEYNEELTKLQSSLYSAKTAIQDFQESMSKSIESQRDTLLDDLNKAYEKNTDEINDQKDVLDDVLNKQKQILDLKEKEHDYEANINKQLKEISKSESRIAELKKAASTGDREAQAELDKLNEDLADKKDSLAEDQHDHEIDLQQDSLDAALSENERLTKAKLDSAKSEYDDKISKLTDLYNREMQLIEKMSDYTKSQFSDALNQINTEFSSLGVTTNQSANQSLLNAQSQVANSGFNTSYTESSSSSSRGAVISALSSGTSPTGDSELNKWVKSNYGSYLTFSEMVNVAKLLGVSGIKSASDMSSGENRNKILKALIAGKFKYGGTVDATRVKNISSDFLSSIGEDALIAVKHNEGVLTPLQNQAWQKISDYAPQLSNIFGGLTRLNPTNYTTNNNSSPTIQINLPANSTITRDAVEPLNKYSQSLVDNVVSQLMYKKKQY